MLGFHTIFKIVAMGMIDSESVTVVMFCEKNIEGYMGTIYDGKYILALVAAVSFFALVLVYMLFLGHGNKKRDLLYLTRQIVPNLLASLLIVVVVYYFIEIWMKVIAEYKS